MQTRRILVASAVLMTAAVVSLTGCYKAPAPDGKQAKSDKTHNTWWCEEHGIPEDECSMCSATVAAERKKNKDWCDKHDRALSQCFVCNPDRQAFYAAKYKAKYGKDAPPLKEALPKDEAPKEKEKEKEKTDK